VAAVAQLRSAAGMGYAERVMAVIQTIYYKFNSCLSNKHLDYKAF
jgi:hypothetical protein